MLRRNKGRGIGGVLAEIEVGDRRFDDIAKESVEVVFRTTLMVRLREKFDHEGIDQEIAVLEVFDEDPDALVENTMKCISVCFDVLETIAVEFCG